MLRVSVVRLGNLGLKVGHMDSDQLLNTYFMSCVSHRHSSHCAGDRGLPGFQGVKGLLYLHQVFKGLVGSVNVS